MARMTHSLVIGALLLTAVGCVSQTRYERLVEQLNAIRIELNVAKAEELALTKEMEALKSRNQEAKLDVLAASDNLQRAREEAEIERHRADGQFVTIQRALGQLNAQLFALRDKLAEAKNDTTALKELAAVYQRKLRAELEAPEPVVSPSEVVEVVPAGISINEPPLVEMPTETTVVQPPEQQEQVPEPQDEGLLFTLMDWFVSLWHSITNFVSGFLPW